MSWRESAAVRREHDQPDGAYNWREVDVAISITGTTSVPATAFVDNFDLPPVVDAVRDGDHHPSR